MNVIRLLLLSALTVVPALAHAKVLNVEYNFAAFVGDVKNDHVTAVPGKARIFLNNVPMGETEVEKGEKMVLFDAREVQADLWIPVESYGAAVRKGKNTIRIEFDPANATAEYTSQLRWATVTDQVKEEDDGGTHKATNQADEGVENKIVKGPIRLEREFTADFAVDHPWHHLPPVTVLSDDDKQQLLTMVKTRAEWFKPDFAPIYKALTGRENFKVGELRKHQCLDAVYKAGLRITAPDDIEFTTTGNQEVVLGGKATKPLYPIDPAPFKKLKGDDLQMCAGMTIATVYPPHLVVVKSSNGNWEVAY